MRPSCDTSNLGRNLGNGCLVLFGLVLGVEIFKGILSWLTDWRFGGGIVYGLVGLVSVLIVSFLWWITQGFRRQR